MNYSLYFFLAYAAIMLLGLIKLILNLRTFSEEEKLFNQYCTHFQTFVSEPEKEEAVSDLDWLIKHSESISVLLGKNGIAYNQGFEEYSIPIHLVPDLCYDLVGFSPASALDKEGFRTIITCLGRFEGVLDQRRKVILRKIK